MNPTLVRALLLLVPACAEARSPPDMRLKLAALLLKEAVCCLGFETFAVA